MSELSVSFDVAKEDDRSTLPGPFTTVWHDQSIVTCPPRSVQELRLPHFRSAVQKELTIK